VPSHIEVSKWKTLEVDPLTMQSADPRVFGGGDCYTGPSSLVAALAAGRRAAVSIDAFLQDCDVAPALEDRLEHAMLAVIRDEAQRPSFSGSTEKLRPMVCRRRSASSASRGRRSGERGGRPARGRALSALLPHRRGGGLR
jgi:formate dehydrogenase beta subunit